VVAGVDPESFVTADATSLADTGATCAGLLAEVQRQGKQAQYKRAPRVTVPDPRYPHRVTTTVSSGIAVKVRNGFRMRVQRS